jgi:hypothetical protein
MVLPFTSKPTTTAPVTNEPPRILTEEEQLLVSIDQGVHEVKQIHLKCIFLTNFRRFLLRDAENILFYAHECEIHSISQTHLVRIDPQYTKMIDE